MKNNNTIVKTAQESKDTNMTPNNIVARKEKQEKKKESPSKRLRINYLFHVRRSRAGRTDRATLIY